MKISSRSLLGPLLAITVALGACAAPTGDTGGTGEEDVGEAYDAATGRPNYTRRNTTLLGSYSGSDYCPGGFDLCTDAVVKKESNGQWSIILGPSQYGENLTLPLIPERGVFVFTSGDGPVSGYDDCQDPGCGNVEKVSGILYARKVGNAWVPTLKVTLDFDFPYPDEQDAPNGHVRHTSYIPRAR